MITEFSSQEAVNEGTTAQYTCTLTDHTGQPINPVAMTEILATLTTADGTVVNTREAQSVLDTNGGTLALGGLFTLVLGEDDTVAIGTQALQLRRLTLQAAYATGTLTHQVQFYIRALADVPAPVV